MLLFIPWTLASLWLWAHGPVAQASDELPYWVVRLVSTGLLVFTFFGLLIVTLGTYIEVGARIEAFLVHTSTVSILLGLGLQYRSQRRRQALVFAERRVELEKAQRERLERFMNMFSHEVRMPLSIVALAVEQGIQDAELARQAGDAIADLDQLVSKSLQVDRLESNAMVNQREEIDLRELVEDCATRLGISDAIRWSSTTAAWVRVDVFLTHVSVTNLLENAVKYGVLDSGIDLELTKNARGALTLFVGNSIHAEGWFDPQRVFEKYFRGEHAVRRSGAGLGLYLARSFMQMQGGDLRLDHLSTTSVRFALEVPS
jgi:K+-sensing histidine kinase KdpD